MTTREEKGILVFLAKEYGKQIQEDNFVTEQLKESTKKEFTKVLDLLSLYVGKEALGIQKA